MAVFFYNIGILLYRMAIQLAKPFNTKAAQWVDGRRGLLKRIEGCDRGAKRLVWFHAASLGEFEQGRPVMEKLREKHPDILIALTFFSPSGYEVRKNYAGADFIFYLPTDRPANVRRFLKALRPDAAVFVKYEYWYHYLSQLQAQRISTFLISAIFRQEQPFFRFWGGLHRRMLRCFTYIFVQDQTSVELLQQIGITHVERTGDTRFDRVKQIAESTQRIEKVEQFCSNRKAVVCGSTWPGDEEIILDYINRHENGYKWILVPHEIGEGHIRAILEKCRKKAVRYTDEQANWSASEVLVVDCIGLLSAIYRYGSIAYIGGGFGKGIHNTLEAAIYGVPVVFGPKYQKFKEAVELLACGGGFSIRQSADFSALLDSLITNPNIAETAGQQALQFVNSQLGATNTILRRVQFDQ